MSLLGPSVYEFGIFSFWGKLPKIVEHKGHSFFWQIKKSQTVRVPRVESRFFSVPLFADGSNFVLANRPTSVRF
jgi:hypothetical protein